MSDLGLRKMTMPFRMFQRGPGDLHSMDVAG